MTDRSTAMARLRMLTSVQLAFFLATWFAFSPLLQAAHLVFADHGHRFCEEHHLFEDVPRQVTSDQDDLRELAAKG